MKSRTMRILCAVTAMLLMLAALPALAEDDGWMSITVGDQHSTFDREGIQLAAYLVATGDYGAWTPVSSFSDIKMFSRDDGSAWISQSLKDLRERVRNRRIPYTRLATTNAAGRTEFRDMPHGIYFIDMYKGPAGLTIAGMLLSTPDKTGEVRIRAVSKTEFNPPTPENEPDIPMIYVPTRKGERLVNIDEYKTALGLGNIQMHVGVCYE